MLKMSKISPLKCQKISKKSCLNKQSLVSRFFPNLQHLKSYQNFRCFIYSKQNKTQVKNQAVYLFNSSELNLKNYMFSNYQICLYNQLILND